MGCAASVPDEDKQNRKAKKGEKGKEPATELEATKAEAPKAEEAKPAEPAKVEEKGKEPEKPKEEAPKEEPKPTEVPKEEPKKEEEVKPAVVEEKKEEPKAEEPKAEPKVEEPKAEEPKVEEPKAEEPKVEEPKAEEPKPVDVVVKPEEVKVEPKPEAPQEAEPPKVEEGSQEAKPSKKPKIAVVYYSTYGHILQLAEQVAEGVKKGGADVDIFQIRETLPEEVLEKMHAPAKAAHPTIELATTLTEYDAFLFGIPTRYGIWPAQWKTFLDATGQIWQSGGLNGKFGGVFTSAASQHGGIETTAFNAITFFTHHGVNFVPLGYAKAFPELTTMTEVMGGTPYGAGTIAGGDGSRQPSDLEKRICVIQGEYFAEVVKKSF